MQERVHERNSRQGARVAPKASAALFAAIVGLAGSGCSGVDEALPVEGQAPAGRSSGASCTATSCPSPDDTVCGAEGVVCDELYGMTPGQRRRRRARRRASVPEIVCGPENCTGCCQGNLCVPGSGDDACGAAGAACDDCSTRSQICGAGGVCAVPCGPGNCRGCCQGNVCHRDYNNNDRFCGDTGLACDDCSGRNQICKFVVGTGRVCVDRCGPSNCNGCCWSNVCYPGSNDDYCGVAGAACDLCADYNMICNPTRVCEIGSCLLGTCRGCCQGTTCIWGNENERCGSGGGQCGDCTTGGNVCYAWCGPGGCDMACVPPDYVPDW